MKKQEILKQIHDFIDMAMQLEETGRASATVYYNTSAKMIEVKIYDSEIKTTLYSGTCYLDWESDSSYGTDTMFPEFREKLQMMLREKAVC